MPGTFVTPMYIAMTTADAEREREDDQNHHYFTSVTPSNMSAAR